MEKGENQYLFNFVICFAGFSVPMGILCSLIFYSLIKGLILGIFGGLLFAGLMCGFVKILSVRKDKLKERYEIKGKVLYEGAANYLADTEAIGGWIFLMEDRLCFVAHSFNFMDGQRIILYSDIIKVTKGKMIRSMAIHLCNNKVEKFIVNNRKKWIDILVEKIACYK